MSGAARRIVLDGPLDLGATLGPLVVSAGDPCVRIRGRDAWIGANTPDGPAAIHVRVDGAEVSGDARGPGAGWAMERLPGLVGALDEPHAYRPHHPFLATAARRRPGLRIPRSARVLDLALGVVCAQKVTGVEAGRAWRGLVRRHGTPAPGTPGLWVPPTAATVAALPYPALHRLGVERRRAETIVRLARAAPRIEAAVDDPDRVVALLGAVAGIGPWTTGHLRMAVLGDPDAVPVGDYHIPNEVAWALAGEPRADDRRMLELLEPERGHRGRALRLIGLEGARPPAYGPRTRPRAIAGI